MQIGGGRRATRQHEGVQGLKPSVQVIDVALETFDLAREHAQALRLAFALGHGEIGAEIEQVVLNEPQHRIELGRLRQVKPDDAGKKYVVIGELRRAGERIALETPLLLLSGGLVFWEDRVAPLRDFDAFQWIALLRDQGEVRVPAKQKQEFLAELLRLPDLPRLDLPDDLRYEEVTPAPRPYLKVKRRETRGWMSDRDQNWLVGDLSFEYDGHVVPARAPARSVFEPDKRRLLLRDPVAERTFAGRLEEVGFHRRTEYGRGEVLELLARLTAFQRAWRGVRKTPARRRGRPQRR